MQRWTERDPLYLRKATPRWFTESGRAQEVLRQRMAGFAYPLLVMVGTGDRIADPRAGEAFLATAASADKRLLRYEHFQHELFNEVGRSAPVADVVSWISARIGAKTD
jgi:alpha-beta hydrolase superfamily lysophospholipase